MFIRLNVLAAVTAVAASAVLLTSCGQDPEGDSAQAAVLAESSRYLSMLPRGEQKSRFVLECTGCHQFDRATVGIDGRFKSEEEWRMWTETMLSFSGAHTTFPILAPARTAEQTAAFLVDALGDERTSLPDLEPVSVDGLRPDAVSFTEYTLPDSMDLPHDLEIDPDGRPVITGQLSDRMYILDPESGAFEQIPVPVENANPRALTIEKDGTWWVLLGGPEKIARYRPGGDDDWTTWDIGMHPHSIVRDDSGRIWFNGHFTKDPEQIGYLDPRDGRVELFDVPTPSMPDGGSTIPYGLRMGPDGAIWGTQLFGGRLIRFDPAAQTFSVFPLPEPYSGPRRPDVGSDGVVWIPEYSAGRLARFDPDTETFREYDLPIKDSLPYVVRVDNDRGWVWIATAAADVLYRFFPDEERFETYPYPTPNNIVRHMALDHTTGNLWLAYGNFPPTGPKIVRVIPQR